jgi:hypothetical protein
LSIPVRELLKKKTSSSSDVMIGEEYEVTSSQSSISSISLDEAVPIDINRSHLKEIQISFVEVDPIEIFEVTDTEGRIKDIVEAMESETGCSVIPFSIASLSPNITYIQDHDIKHLKGEHFSFSRVVRDSVIEDYKERIISKLRNGIPFYENLWTSFSYNNVDYFTLKLSECEWTLICSMFRKCNAKIYCTDADDFTISIDNCTLK